MPREIGSGLPDGLNHRAIDGGPVRPLRQHEEYPWLCQDHAPCGTMPGCTFDDPATFGSAFRLTASATPPGCITDTA